MKWPRSIAALAAGSAVMTIVLRIGNYAAPSGSLAWFVFSTILGAMAAGFLTAWIAGSHEIPHGAGLGFVMIGATLYSMHRDAVAQPGWYEITLAGCGPIASMFGAALLLLGRRRYQD